MKIEVFAAASERVRVRGSESVVKIDVFGADSERVSESVSERVRICCEN